MARLIYFHIGLPKTGTTFLQTAMWHNRAHLREQGVLYPGRARMDHFNASQAVREVPGAPKTAGRAWSRLVRQLSKWDGVGLISHEFFCTATAEQARAAVAALAPAEVRVVVTARDYVRQFPAVWQEALKIGHAGSLDQFMTKALERRQSGPWSWQSQDIPAVLERWSHAVAQDHIEVITVPPPGAPRELLWRRWCEVTGVDDSSFDMDLTLTNESLGAAQAALMHRVKPYLSGVLNDGPTRHRWLRRYFGHEVLVPQKGERFGMDPEHAAELRELSLQAVEEIREAGYHVTGDLADLVPDPHQDGRPHPGQVGDEEIVEVAARAIEQMIRDVRQLSLERDHWRHRATSTGSLPRVRRAAHRGRSAVRRLRDRKRR